MTNVPALNLDDAIEEAFRRIIKDFTPQMLDVDKIRSARLSIRLMLDDWNTDGVLFFKLATQQVQALTVGQGSFVAVANTIDILNAAVLRGNIRVPMDIISEDQYFRIPDLTISSMPRKLWPMRSTEPPTCKIWPVSENSTDSIVYDALTYFLDSFSTLAGTIDVARYANQAFVACLATALAEKHAPERYQEKLLISGYPGNNAIMGAYGRFKMANRERGDTIISVRRRR